MTKIKDIQTALSLFEESADKHAESTEVGDYKTCNKHYKIITKAIDFLKESNQMFKLKQFLKHHSIGVRSWAATFLLPIDENESLRILEDISKTPGIHSLNAKMTISEWNKGNLIF